MSKYSKEEIIAAIKEVESGYSINQIARERHISWTVLQVSLRRYEKHGEKGIYPHAYGWSAGQKVEALNYMHENNLSFTETGVLLGISNRAVWEWERRYLENGINGLEDKSKDRKPRVQKPKPPKTRLEELEEENLNLRIENEYLKKLNALVAEREKRERANR